MNNFCRVANNGHHRRSDIDALHGPADAIICHVPRDPIVHPEGKVNHG